MTTYRSKRPVECAIDGEPTSISVYVSARTDEISGSSGFQRNGHSISYILKINGVVVDATGSTIIGDAGEIGQVDYLGQAHLNSLRRGETSRLMLDEGLIDGSPSTREAELLVVPGMIYGIGDSYRRQERTYQISTVPAGRPPATGLVLRDEAGKEAGYSGYDGIVTVDGRAKSLGFEHEGQTCHVAITGNEPEVGGLPQLVATCDPAKQDPNGEGDPVE